jgi:hypothetical protein
MRVVIPPYARCASAWRCPPDKQRLGITMEIFRVLGQPD